jgi:hypothetical protein
MPSSGPLREDLPPGVTPEDAEAVIAGFCDASPIPMTPLVSTPCTTPNALAALWVKAPEPRTIHPQGSGLLLDEDDAAGTLDPMARFAAAVQPFPELTSDDPVIGHVPDEILRQFVALGATTLAWDTDDSLPRNGIDGPVLVYFFNATHQEIGYWAWPGNAVRVFTQAHRVWAFVTLAQMTYRSLASLETLLAVIPPVKESQT